MTAKQDKLLQQQQQQQNTAPDLLPPSDLDLSSCSDLIIPTVLHTGHTQPETLSSGALPRPTCAPYFSGLIKSTWAYFGLSPSSARDSTELLAMEMDTISNTCRGVYHILKARLMQVGLGRKYTSYLHEGQSQSMNLADARAYASRRVILEVGKKIHHPAFGMSEWEATDLVRDFDRTITQALRWKSLFDAVGVPEALLIHYDKGQNVTGIVGNTPLPDLTSVSDGEWPSLLNMLLSPAFGLKRTCIKLSGVVDMIQQLKGLEDRSEYRNRLVANLERRIRDVLVDENRHEDYEDVGEDDESMADADSSYDAGAI